MTNLLFPYMSGKKCAPLIERINTYAAVNLYELATNYRYTVADTWQDPTYLVREAKPTNEVG